MSYNDKRLIINAREPKENEFVMADNVIINSSWVRELMDYIDKNSNLSVEWIDREHQMLNGKLRSELSIEKKNHDLVKEEV